MPKSPIEPEIDSRQTLVKRENDLCDRSKDIKRGERVSDNGKQAKSADSIA